MEKWRVAFDNANSGVQISYLADGSGKGRASVIGNKVDFAGSDAPLNAAESANMTDALHIPVVAGAVLVAYNVPELGTTPLKLDSATIASIFLGTITKWNDPAIAALNPGVTLPAQDITVVVRSDGSGTTATFTDYLNKADSRWTKANGGPGTGSTVNWPAASTTKENGNQGVGQTLQTTPYSVGYIGADWANISALQHAVVKNSAGSFADGTPAAASAALAAALAAGAFDANLKGSATNAGGADSYPITAVSWIIVHQHNSDANKAAALRAFLHYVLHDGQALNTANNYAPMPDSLVSKADAFVASIG
jgi:phosphate transport system substrate-binding protein